MSCWFLWARYLAGGMHMSQFDTLQQHARQLPQAFKESFSEEQGCMFFFQFAVPSVDAINDSVVISHLAESLDSEHDDALSAFFQNAHADRLITAEQYLEFKKQILTGMYLLKWSKYTPSVFSANNSLITLFQAGLAIKSPTELDEHFIGRCFDALSHYCSFVYANKHITLYSDLNQRLGISIQTEIHQALHAKEDDGLSWYTVLSGAIETLGIK